MYVFKDLTVVYIQMDKKEIMKKHCKERFLEGLFEAGGTSNEDDYKYAGGNSNLDLNEIQYCIRRKRIPTTSEYNPVAYFINVAQEKYPWIDKKPPIKYECVCGVKIKEQCYLVNIKTQKTIVVGNCCVRHYLEKEFGKRCIDCDSIVKNMKDSICKDCRKKRKEEAKKEEKRIKQEQREQARKAQLEYILYSGWANRYNKTKELDDNIFTTRRGEYAYKELVIYNHSLASWVMKSNANYRLKDYLSLRLDFDEDYNVVRILEPPKELSVYKTT